MEREQRNKTVKKTSVKKHFTKETPHVIQSRERC